jgi:putative SOS response-associated peptidase YedK
VRPFHDRQVVVLGPAAAAAWLAGAPEAESLRAPPAGALAVEKVAV